MLRNLKPVYSNLSGLRWSDPVSFPVSIRTAANFRQRQGFLRKEAGMVATSIGEEIDSSLQQANTATIRAKPGHTLMKNAFRYCVPIHSGFWQYGFDATYTHSMAMLLFVLPLSVFALLTSVWSVQKKKNELT